MKIHYRVEIHAFPNIAAPGLRRFLPSKYKSEELAFSAMASVRRSFTIWEVTEGVLAEKNTSDGVDVEIWKAANNYQVEQLRVRE